MQPLTSSQSLKALRDHKRAIAQHDAPAAAYESSPHHPKLRYPHSKMQQPHRSTMSLGALRACKRAIIERNELAAAHNADLSMAFASLRIDVSFPACH
jgi:hypothetical protein